MQWYTFNHLIGGKNQSILEGDIPLLVQSIYGTKQAARKWHSHISDWINNGYLPSTLRNNGYLAVNIEKTIFKKTKGFQYIIYGLFVDDTMHISSCDELIMELMDKYSRYFEVTGGDLMKISGNGS